jgi:hypothetical protein
MKPKQAFGVAVRVVGLIVTLVGAYFILCGSVLIIDPEYSAKLAPAWHYFQFGIADTAAGLLLIRGVRFIVRFAFPDKDSDTGDSV